MTLNYYPQFFTATILEWKHLLVLDSMKQTIISSLQYLVNEGRVEIWICIDAKSYSSTIANSGWTRKGKSSAKHFEIYCTANEVCISSEHERT